MKSTKKALTLSVLSLVLCFTMLLGTTYAWFTDSVTSGKSRIVAGNLDVEMFYKNALTSKDKTGDAQWANVVTADAVDPMFFVDADGEKILWEPGVVSVCDFEVRNVGTLALKYKLNTEFEDGTDSGITKKLSSVIKAAVVAADTDVSTREKAIEAGKAVEGGFQNLAVFANEGVLAPKGKTLANYASDNDDKDDKDTFKVILYWEPVETDNDYNMNNEKQDEAHDNTMWIDIDVKLIAAQLTEEKDSFDYDYDKDATYPGNTASEATLTFDDDNPTVVTGIADETAETVVIPVTATKIADNAFKGNTSIKSISMPVTTEVGEGAFDGCSNLTDVTLVVNDNQKATINTEAFHNCENLETVTINGDCTLGSGSFSSDYGQAWDSCDFVFNGNVEVGAFTFFSTGSTFGDSTVTFNGDVEFANAPNIFIQSSVEQITFAAGKKIVIPNAIMPQMDTIKRVVFEGAPADGSYIHYNAFSNTHSPFEGVFIKCSKEEWLAVNAGGAAPAQVNMIEDHSVNSSVTWKDPAITADRVNITTVTQLPTVFATGLASYTWTVNELNAEVTATTTNNNIYNPVFNATIGD